MKIDNFKRKIQTKDNLKNAGDLKNEKNTKMKMTLEIKMN